MREVEVKGYEGLYTVTEDGAIYSVKGGKRKRMKACPNKGGYYVVNLWKDSGYKSYYVHWLVAEAFIGKPTGLNPDGTPFKTLPEIDHIDCNKNNNSYTNLRWCDRYFNLQRINRGTKIVSVDSEGNEKEWDSMTECANKLGLHQSNISNCISGKMHKTGGYTFRKFVQCGET